MDDDETTIFINSLLPQYERLTRVASSLIESILTHHGVPFLNITARTKTPETVREKANRKSYSNIPSQMTDLSGIRVITFLDSQVHQISQVMSTAFEIDSDNSLDRSQILGNDRVGYRSIHFVCSLGNQRKNILEYKDIASLKFEVQIRTVLQHAWAELTHDRSYKFGGSLPADIQRRLNLYAGMLEIADTAFDEIAKSIDQYRAQLHNKERSSLQLEAINSISLDEFFAKIADQYNLRFSTETKDDAVGINELTRFGVETLGDLEALITGDVIDNEKESVGTVSRIGFLRRLMMYNNIEKYLEGGRSWGGLSAISRRLLAKKYGEENLQGIFAKSGRYLSATKRRRLIKPPSIAVDKSNAVDSPAAG